jgi:hypothetical protein
MQFLWPVVYALRRLSIRQLWLDTYSPDGLVSFMVITDNYFQ